VHLDDNDDAKSALQTANRAVRILSSFVAGPGSISTSLIISTGPILVWDDCTVQP
jgi:hypothetical protein